MRPEHPNTPQIAIYPFAASLAVFGPTTRASTCRVCLNNEAKGPLVKDSPLDQGFAS
jgi:hypothetical protein